MSIILNLTQEEETLLRNAASAVGKDVSTYIKASALATARNRTTPSQEIAENRREQWEQMEHLGLEAGEIARAELRSKGISVYYLKDGTLYEELPDGTTHPVPVSE